MYLGSKNASCTLLILELSQDFQVCAQLYNSDQNVFPFVCKVPVATFLNLFPNGNRKQYREVNIAIWQQRLKL